MLRRAKRLRTLESMEVDLSQDQKEFVRLAVESGRLRDEGEAVRQALALWEERERARAELMAAVDAAEDSLARGEGRELTEQSVRRLASDVMSRGRERLARETIGFQQPGS